MGRGPVRELVAYGAREKRGVDGTRLGRTESKRRVEGYERVAEMAAEMPGPRLVYLAGREADVVEMMRRARANTARRARCVSSCGHSASRYAKASVARIASTLIKKDYSRMFPFHFKGGLKQYSNGKRHSKFRNILGHRLCWGDNSPSITIFCSCLDGAGRRNFFSFVSESNNRQCRLSQ